MKLKPYERKALNEIIKRIVERFNPEKIILFGSYAHGSPGPDSDVDLLVVMQIEGSRRSKATAMDLALVGVEVPVDLIVVTPEEIEKHRDQIGTIIRPALREGEVLYERTA
ncbi:MAG: nucleotidyltransferase domain-containing protein [Nitrospirae bacterium CG17_big_fil_post_rev_8_21_14_2_50_50_9]|nr:MAG: hypothetical protein AUK29_03855 [Nitrospirae bacterium CG2_30_53_67]PIV84898.1 MAG: nucleotidyltransferase domain-containing protein [Nitrospirae bacterium CG17_big_fil_post_rev_8_21_14_2_50_50_9]